MSNILSNDKLAKLALINEQLVSLLPDSFSSKNKLVEWLNTNPYSPYIVLYGGEKAIKFNKNRSFISPTDNKTRFILEDRISFKLENFKNFDNKILSANTKLSNIINSKELFLNYPEFKDLNVAINISNANNGFYSGNTIHNGNKANKINIFASNNEEAMRVLLHELQHCIQLKEGFAIGKSYYNEYGVMDLFIGINKTQTLLEAKKILSKDTMFNDKVLFEDMFENPEYYNENKKGLKVKLIEIDPYDYLEAVNKVKPEHKHSDKKLLSLKDAYDKGTKVDVPYLTYGSIDIDEEADKNSFGQEGYNRAVNATYIGRKKIPVFVRYREGDKNIPQAIQNAIDFTQSAFSDIATKKSMIELNDSNIKIKRFRVDIKEAISHIITSMNNSAFEKDFSSSRVETFKNFYNYNMEDFIKEHNLLKEELASILRNQNKDLQKIKEITSKKEPYDLILKTMENYHSGKLEDFIEYNELFTRYPELRELRISIDESMNSSGSYTRESENQGKIIKLKNFSLDGLLHELQHSIQDIEKWARGGSPNEFANNKELKKLLQEQQEELKKSLGYNNWEYEILLEDYDKYIQLLEKGKNNYSVQPFYEEFAKEKNLKEDIAQYFVNKMLYFDNEISSLNSSDNPYDSYQRLWGEQQARAVQYRMNMTDKERAKESWTNTLEQKEGQYGKPIVKYSNEENQLKAEKENTSRLKEWHKDSHSLTKNENGTPKIFYHGTRADSFDVFNISKPLYGEQAEGAYFSSSKSNAKKYGDKIYAVYLKFENPLVLDAYGQNYNDIADSINHQSKWAKEDGYDSVIIKNIKDSPNGKGGVIQDTLIAFEPTQIKSVNNQGIFNENNPNIMMNQSMSLSNLLENDIVNQNKIREIELKALLSKDKLEEYITLSDEKKIISILEDIIVTDIINNNLQKEFYKTFGKDISNLKDIHIDTKKEIISSLSSYENYVDLKQSKLHCDALLNILNKDYDELVNKISTYKDWDFLANTEYSLSNYFSSVQGKESLLFIGSNGDEISSFSDIATKTTMLEIDSSKAKLQNNILTIIKEYESSTLGDILIYDELFEKYPNLKDVEILFVDGPENERGSYNNKKNLITINSNMSNPDNILSTLLHEVQHSIQYIEKWAKGGNINEFNQSLDENTINLMLKNLGEAIFLKELSIKYNYDIDKITFKKDTYGYDVLQNKNAIRLAKNNSLEWMQKEYDNYSTNAVTKYMSLWGEQQARAVQFRLKMNIKDRQKESWTETLVKTEGRYEEPIIKHEENGIIENRALKNEDFKEWFKDSKIINEDGNPLLLYHGTNTNFDTFDINKSANGWLGKGFYFTDKKEATKNFGKKRMLVHLNMKNPYISNSNSPSDLHSEIKDKFYEDKGYLQDIKIEEALKENGYDGIIYKHWDNSNGIFYAAFEPSQIKIVDKQVILKNNKKINKIDNLQEWHKDSSIITKNSDGSPKVFYHGTKNSFDEFKENKIGESYGNQFGRGFYFTDNEQKANGYGYGEGGNVMPVYLNIQKIADFNDMKQEDLQKFKQVLNKVIDINKDAGYGSVRKIDITNYPKEKQYKLHDELIEKTDKYWHDRAKVKVIKEDGKIYLSYMEADLKNADGLDILGLLMHKQMLSLVTSLGFDGVKIGDEFIVFEPTQIKSVFNNGTFDKNNPNILERNDLGLRNLEMIMSIIPNNMNMDTVKDYLFFNNITHEQLRGTIYNDILTGSKFDASKIRIPNANSIDFDSAYFQSAGEKESREIENIYINKINNITKEKIVEDTKEESIDNTSCYNFNI